MSHRGVVEELYENQVKPLSAPDRLRLVELIARELAGAEEAPRRDLRDLRGLGKDCWEGVDPEEYVRKLRSEWEG